MKLPCACDLGAAVNTVAELPPTTSKPEQPISQWYAAYTFPRHEKYVARQLDEKSIDSFLPLYRSLRRWKDRRKQIALAAQSYVSYSFEDEFSTLRTNGQGTHELLAALKQVVPGCKFYFAGSSEMFGKVEASPQNERTSFHPRSTYAISKVAGFQLCQYYREAYDLFVCSGILFNHESPRRGIEFVTRKITSQLARIKLGLCPEVRLGNLEAKRDWGHAREYVEAMWRMLQQPQPDDYVIATGESHSVREFCEVAFAHLGLDYREWVKVDSELFRPADVAALVGDASKANRVLGWQHQVSWKDLIVEMVERDLEKAQVALRAQETFGWASAAVAS